MPLSEARKRIASATARAALRAAEAAHRQANDTFRRAEARNEQTMADWDRIVERNETYTATIVTAATLRAARAAVNRSFHERMATGPWQAVGRRGAATASLSAIPSETWPDLRVTDWEPSRLAEPDGTLWYGVGVEIVTGIKRVLAQVFKAHPRGDMRWKEYCEEVRERLPGHLVELPTDKTIQNHFYAWRREQPGTTR
jgi:hypothetical protein